jgi:hypothetical protein
VTRLLAFCFLAILAAIAGEIVSGFVMGMYDMKEPPTIELKNVIRWPLLLLAVAWFMGPREAA